MRPYQGFRDYGPEMFALNLETSEGHSDDLRLVQQMSSNNPESGAYGKLWAQYYKDDEDELPSTEEVINGLLNWICKELEERHDGVPEQIINQTK